LCRYEQLAYDAAAEALPPKDHHDVGAQNNAMKRKTKIARMYEEMNEFEKKRVSTLLTYALHHGIQSYYSRIDS